MAFVDDTTQDENQSQTDQTQPQAGQASGQTGGQSAQPNITSSAGAGVATAGGASAGPGAGTGVGATNASNTGSTAGAVPGAPAGQSQPTSSNDGWTNLQSYLTANNGQGDQIGTTLTNSINQQGQNAQNDINNLSSGFQQQVVGNTVNYDANAVNQDISDAQNLQAGGILSQNDVTNFQNQTAGTYNGPTDITQQGGYAQSQSDINNALAAANNAQTEGGRDQLLQANYSNNGQGGYNQGEANLDNLLLENSPTAGAALAAEPAQWSGLSAQLSNAVNTGGNEVAAAQATNKATAASANAALQNADTGFQNTLNTEVSNLQNTDQTAYNNILSALNSGQITPAEAQQLGISANNDNYLYNAPAAGQTTGSNEYSKYLTEAAAPTVADTATANQYAEAQALAQLGGQGQSSILSPATINQAGTAETANPYTFNGAQYTADNSTAQGEYQGAQNAWAQQVTNALPYGNQQFQGQSPTQIAQILTNQINQTYNAQPGDPTYGNAGAMAQAQQMQQLLNQLNTVNEQYGQPTVAVPFSKTGGAVMH